MSQPQRSNARGNRRGWIGLVGALVVGALVAQAALSGMVPALKVGRPSSSHSTSSDAYGDDSQAAFDAYLEDIGAIAEDAAHAMADASAEATAAAGAEVDASSRLAADALADAAAEGSAAVAAATTAAGALPAAPSGYTGGAVSPGSVVAGGYGTPGHTFEVDGPGGGNGTWDGSESSFGARVGLNRSPTGNSTVDGGLTVLADLWLQVKQDVNATGSSNGVVEWQDDDFGTYTAEGEDLTYTARPDENGAAAAEAHARQVLTSAQDVLATTLAGLQAKVEVEAALYEAVYAEINQTLAAEAEAEAAIAAEADARVAASFAAAAEKEAEVSAQAEHQISLVRSAQAEAKQRVRAQAEQHASAVLNASAAAAAALEQQASAVQQAAADAAAAIRAAEAAALKAAYAQENATGADLSGRIATIAQAAQAAEAAVWARAEAQQKVLLSAAASARAAGEVKAKAVLSAAVDAEARIDAKAEVAVQATLRAKAYAVAKARAEAEARAEAHLHAAQKAVARARMAADAHIRVVIEAALELSLRMSADFDGSRPFAEMVKTESTAEASKDVAYIREVQGDYERQAALDRDGRAEHWESVAYDLEQEMTVVTDTAAEIDATVDEYHELFLTTYKDIEALGEKFL